MMITPRADSWNHDLQNHDWGMAKALVEGKTIAIAPGDEKTEGELRVSQLSIHRILGPSISYANDLLAFR